MSGYFYDLRHSSESLIGDRMCTVRLSDD
jgi:hypothetical protein